MREPDPRVHLEDILENMELAQSFMAGVVDAEDLEEDKKTLYSLVRALEIIGEATKRLSEDVRRLSPEVPWREMAGMRDRLIHGYDSVDIEIVCQTVEHRIPEILPKIRALLSRLDAGSGERASSHE